MDSSTSTGKLLLTLKQQLRVKGLHYRDVAGRLKVSEGTVKRYFSGKGVGIDTLEKLAKIVDLDLLSLATLAQQHNIEGGLNLAQQAAVARHTIGPQQTFSTSTLLPQHTSNHPSTRCSITHR